jgi:hypothetical protein
MPAKQHEDGGDKKFRHELLEKNKLKFKEREYIY